MYVLEDLAAIAQALAFLDFIKEGDGFVRQPEQHFLLARCGQTAAVGALLVVAKLSRPSGWAPLCVSN